LLAELIEDIIALPVLPYLSAKAAKWQEQKCKGQVCTEKLHYGGTVK